MDLITIGTTAAIAVPTIAAVALYFDGRTLRKRLSVLKERVDFAQDLNIALRERRDKLECQAASDGNRLSELRAEKADLNKRHGEALATIEAINDRNADLALECDDLRERLDRRDATIAELQPLADKALAAQAQRVRASQAAKAKRDARRSQAV